MRRAAEAGQSLEPANRAFRRAFIRATSHSTDTLRVCRRIEYGWHREGSPLWGYESGGYGFKLKGRDIGVGSILSRLIFDSVPESVAERFPDLTTKDLDAVMWFCEVLFRSFTVDTAYDDENGEWVWGVDVPEDEDDKADRHKVVRALAAIGIRVSNIQDLVKRKSERKAAIPTLLRLLKTVRTDRSRVGIIRALAIPGARGVATVPLIEEFKKIQPDDPPVREWVKCEIGDALVVVADKASFSELVALVRDPRHGQARDMLPLALARVGGTRAVSVLIDLLDDQGLVDSAVIALGRLKDPAAIPGLTRLLKHRRNIVREEAGKAIARILGEAR